MSEMIRQGLGIAEIIGDKRDAILTVCARYGATGVRVFGSVARGEATPESDLDLLVNFHSGASLYDLAGLRRDLMALLGREVDIVSDHAGLRERLRRHIWRDAVPL